MTETLTKIPQTQTTNGTLEAIWLKTAKRGAMKPVSQASLTANRGLDGSADQGGKRQVTIIEREIWNSLMADLGVSLDPSTRRANLMVSGITLAETVGKIIQIGDVRIRILGETLPCELMNKACPGLREALGPNWGGGAYGEVLNDAEIAIGNTVSWVE